MVLAYHVIFGAYGFWLPNDPRGSWSDFVGAWDLFLAGGQATTTDERCSVARRSHDRELRLATKRELKRPAVKFTGVQALAVGRGFRNYVRKSGLCVWACSILPEHVHLVVGRFRLDIEQVVVQLKAAATRELVAENIHPFAELARPGKRPPKCWSRGEWSVFLESADDISRSIRYVENNPVKDGKPRQQWTFVTPFDRPPCSRDAQRSAMNGLPTKRAPLRVAATRTHDHRPNRRRVRRPHRRDARQHGTAAPISTHGVLRLVLRTDGEIISEVVPHLGYLHRCAEKIGENVLPDPVHPVHRPDGLPRRL